MESAQARKARSWLVEGIGTGTVQYNTEYDIFDADADSTGQGSTRGRTQLGCGVQRKQRLTPRVAKDV